MERFKQHILDTEEDDISNGEQVVVPLENHMIWFTQTHFAEIQQLIKLTERLESYNSDLPTDKIEKDAEEKSGLSVYKKFIGKTIRRKRDNFEGVIADVDDSYLTVSVKNGEKAGQETKIFLKFVLEHKAVYQIE